MPDYWVVDVKGRCVRTFAGPAGGAYTAVHTARAGDRLVPSAVEVDPLQVQTLLAGL